ncbi:MAG: ABC transporter substrate-binding protein, partial [Caldimonas sp.]
MSPTGIDRRRFNVAAVGSLAAAGAWPAAQAAETDTGTNGANVLRILFEAAETGFDPVGSNDLYSNRVKSHIFESLIGYDPIAVPVRPVPVTAEALPEVSADFRTWTLRLARGTLFANDPAFKGRPRELVAADYVFAIKRIFDPATKSPFYSTFNDEGIVGLDELRQRALRDKAPFDYQSEIDGLRALDRYTLQFRLSASRPRFASTIASQPAAAVAKEVVDAYGADIAAHPVGTGPYRIKSWRRSSRIVLEKSPTYRDVRYDAQPAAGDTEGQAWAKRFN